MGAVLVKKEIYDAFQEGDVKAIDLFHGYTYSAHPIAAAALIATLDVYSEDNLFESTNDLASYWEDALHSLKGTSHVIDIRNLGLVAGIEMSPREGSPGTRGYDVFTDGFHNHNLLLRITGDTIALSPPLIVEKEHIDQIIDILKKIIPTH
jgi:beta-alanine--pyruvate transaminase